MQAWGFRGLSAGSRDSKGSRGSRGPSRGSFMGPSRGPSMGLQVPDWLLLKASRLLLTTSGRLPGAWLLLDTGG